MELNRPRNKPGFFLPAEPFRRVVRERLAKLTDNEHLGAFTQVGLQIWGPDNDFEVQKCHDSLRTFMRSESKDHTGELVHFDLADKILTRLGLAGLWVSDPDFSELYYAADLASLDVSAPTCDKIRDEIVETVQELGVTKTAEVFNTKVSIVRHSYRRAIAA